MPECSRPLTAAVCRYRYMTRRCLRPSRQGGNPFEPGSLCFACEFRRQTRIYSRQGGNPFEQGAPWFPAGTLRICSRQRGRARRAFRQQHARAQHAVHRDRSGAPAAAEPRARSARSGKHYRPHRQTVSSQQALHSQARLVPWLPQRLSRAACRGRGRATKDRGSRRLKFRIIATVSTTTSSGLLVLAQPLRRRAPFPTSPAAPCASDNPCGF